MTGKIEVENGTILILSVNSSKIEKSKKICQKFFHVGAVPILCCINNCY